MSLRATKKNIYNLSLHDPVGTDRDGNEINLLDVLKGDEVLFAEDLDRKLQTKTLYEKLPSLLTEQELFVITRRYGLFSHDELTQREIAKTLGISRSYVSSLGYCK